MNINFKQILSQIESEEKSALQTLHMTANENVMSKSAERIMASCLSSRYYSDTYHPEHKIFDQKFYVIGNAMYRGMPSVYALEDLARKHSNQMFHAEFSDFIPLSGMHAVTCILSTMTKPGDKVFTFAPQSIGHHATISLLRNLGRTPLSIPWDDKNMCIDLEAFAKSYKNESREKPVTIFFDLGKTFYPLPIKAIRKIVGDDAKIIYDASHVLGLIAGGLFQNPLQEGCDVLIGNTHKTFPGPQKALLLYANKELGQKTALELFSTAVSSQHTHHSMALYITILEMSVYGKAYAQQILKNAHTLARALIAKGFRIVSREHELPHAHMIGISGGFKNSVQDACMRLHLSNISSNTQKIFGKDCVRIGVQELTRRGMMESDMEQIAEFFKAILIDESEIGADVLNFNKRFHKVCYTLDDELSE